MSVRENSPAYRSVLRSEPTWMLRWRNPLKQAPTVSSAPYRYIPVKADSPEIRLITLFSRKRTTTNMLEVTIKHVSLNQKPAYAALSYVWGDTKAVIFIRVNGQMHGITSNLEVALRHLQHERRDLVLWVDSICLYVDQHEAEYHQNLRVGPLFSDGFPFAPI